MSKKDLDVLVAKVKNIPNLKFEDIKYMGVPITDMTKEQLMACLAHSIGMNMAGIKNTKLKDRILQVMKDRQKDSGSRRVVDLKDGQIYTELTAPGIHRCIAIAETEAVNKSQWLRNEPCVCKSGVKFKNCCLGKDAIF